MLAPMTSCAMEERWGRGGQEGVFYCAGVTVAGALGMLVVRSLCQFFVARRCLFPATTDDVTVDGIRFARDVADIVVSIWLYPVAGVMASIMLLTASHTLLCWPRWMDTLTCLCIGHLVSVAILASASPFRPHRLHLHAASVRYVILAVINVCCLFLHQLSFLVLLVVIVQLPHLLCLFSRLSCHRLCPGLWTMTWGLWLASVVLFGLLMPMYFTNQAFIERTSHKLDKPASAVMIAATVWFAVLFLWLLSEPLMAIYKRCRQMQYEDNSDSGYPILTSNYTSIS